MVCPVAATLLLGCEDDLYAAMPASFAFVAALMCWPSCFAVDSPGVLAALSGFLRRLGFGAARAGAVIFGDGCRGVAQSGIGPVTVASWGCFHSFHWGFASLPAAFEMLVGAVAVGGSSSSQYEVGRDRERLRAGAAVHDGGDSGHGRVRHPSGGSQEGSGRARAHALCV